MHSASADSLNTLTKSPQQKSLLIHRFWHVDIVALHPRIQDPGIRIQKEPRSYPALIPFTRLTKSASANGPHIQCEPLRRLNRREFSSPLHRGELRHRDCFRSETNGDSLNTPQAKAAFHRDAGAASLCATARHLRLRCAADRRFRISTSSVLTQDFASFRGDRDLAGFFARPGSSPSCMHTSLCPRHVFTAGCRLAATCVDAVLFAKPCNFHAGALPGLNSQPQTNGEKY